MAPSTPESRTASTTEHATSVFDLRGDELAAYIAWHRETFGVPPLAGGAPNSDDDDEEDTDDDDDDAADRDDADTDDESDDDQDEDDAEGDAEYWKKRSRHNERLAKKREKELKTQQDKVKTAKLSDQEKAVAKAREEAKAQAREEADKEIRETRLEASVTRLATAFADPEDALHQIQIAVRKGDLDEDDIFDDNGKVQTAEVEKALKAILKRKPHLKGEASGRRFQGGSDARKGTGGKKTAADMSVDDHIKAVARK